MSTLKFAENQLGDLPVAPPQVEVFIETGTCEGNTLANAAAVFGECLSIELHYPNYLNNAKKFLPSKNVRVFYGSSPDVLPNIINPNKTTLFWLDAHFMPGLDVSVPTWTPIPDCKPDKYGQCPLLAELDAIVSLPWSVPFYVLIDDSHLFEPKFWDTPTKDFERDGFHFKDMADFENVSWSRTGLKRDEWPMFDQIQQKLPQHTLEKLHPVLMGKPKLAGSSYV